MSAARFQSGDGVAVAAAYPPGHVRTPYFIRGKPGVIDSVVGNYPNPEELAYGRDGLPALPLYRVRFKQTDVWPDYAGPANDTVVIDIYESWLEPTS
tara:strand:- start:21576 stop:21866 length:291 start_codon:yes stop_codon:yes gene_type:complete